MELALHISSSLPTLFRHHVKTHFRETQLRIRARGRFSCTNVKRSSLLLSDEEREELWRIHQGVELDEEEGDLEEDENNYDSSFLALSEKPDRNTALLDDYEIEELDYGSTNHKSGR